MLLRESDETGIDSAAAPGRSARIFLTTFASRFKSHLPIYPLALRVKRAFLPLHE
jgi:hypothetical protein